MLLAIECMIACIIFAVIVLSTQYKDPVKYIMSYPPEIRKRVESLPAYENSIKKTEKRHILKKLIAVFVFIALLSAISYFSGAKNFQTAFLHVFILFFSVNLFDVVVLDFQIQEVGVFLSGYAAQHNTIALSFLKNTVSLHDSWKVQEILAMAFDNHCKMIGYEAPLPIIKEWLNSNCANVRRAASEGLRVWICEKVNRQCVERYQQKISSNDFRRIELMEIII